MPHTQPNNMLTLKSNKLQHLTVKNIHTNLQQLTETAKTKNLPIARVPGPYESKNKTKRISIKTHTRIKLTTKLTQCNKFETKQITHAQANLTEIWLRLTKLKILRAINPSAYTYGF